MNATHTFAYPASTGRKLHAHKLHGQLAWHGMGLQQPSLRRPHVNQLVGACPHDGACSMQQAQQGQHTGILAGTRQVCAKLVPVHADAMQSMARRQRQWQRRKGVVVARQSLQTLAAAQ